KTDEPSSVPIDLPELEISNMVLRFRVPSVLNDAPEESARLEFLGRRFPEHLGPSDYLSKISVSLKPSLTLNDGLDLRFSTDCDRWGKMDVFGTIGRDLKTPKI